MRSRFLMILSLIVLGLGLIGIIFLKATDLQEGGSVAESSISQPEKNIIIWKTKRDLEKGESISRDDLRAVKVSEQEAFDLGVDQDIEIYFVEGMVIKTAMLSETPVFPEDIVTPNQKGYFSYVIEPGYVPATVVVSEQSVVGGVVSSGSIVDVLVLASATQNLADRPQIRDLDSVSVAPLFMGVKVLQTKKQSESSNLGDKITSTSDSQEESKTTLILQLTRKQVAELTIAQNIAQIEVHLSNGETSLSALSADSGDILSDYKSVRELRAGSGSNFAE